jgi:hypothetical protein
MALTSTLFVTGQPKPNHPAAGKAGFAPQLTVGHHWPGLLEPGRSASMFWKTPLLLVAILTLLGKEAHATTYWVPRCGSPVLVGDKLVFAEPGREPHRLICIGKKDGKKVWETTDVHNLLRVWFAVSNQCIVTVGNDVEKCDPATGQLALLHRTGYEGAVWLRNLQDGNLLVGGETNNVDYLACLDSRFWQRVWERPRITRTVALGQDALLCGEASRKTATNGSYSPIGERWVALSKQDGKLLWSCPPFANATAISNYFLAYLKDTITCLNQRDGETVKEFRIQQQPYAQASLTSKDQQLLVRTFQSEFDTNYHPKYVFFSLAVPGLQWRKLTEIEWNSALEAENDVRDDDYAYSASIAPQWDITSITRTETKTGKREDLYQEGVPPALRPHPLPPTPADE